VYLQNTLAGTKRTKNREGHGWGRLGAEKALYNMGRLVMAAHARIMLDVDIKWNADLPRGAKILAANHPTTTDPFYILTLLSEPVSVLVTAGLFETPGFGGYLRRAGHVPAIRGSGGATVKVLRQKVEDGRTVAIFPEGALSPGEGQFHKPHTGIARVALGTGAAVVPVGIGLDHGRIRTLELEEAGEPVTAKLYLKGPYALTVGEPLWFKGSADDRARVREVAGEIMDHVVRLSRESAGRVQRPVAEPVGVPQLAG
jgi:1-acyl-sn-glycerol-3-phosphate acyltransferase